MVIADLEIAEIAIEPKTRRITKVNFHRTHLRFRCQRCAVFCCKLGAPKLFHRDIERLKQAGYFSDLFFNLDQASLQSTNDGSCVFLSFNPEDGLYRCSVYEQRPTLCRLYPFKFEKSGPQFYVLKLIPCCNGLNVDNGQAVDKQFLSENLEKILLDLISFGFFDHNFEKETRCTLAFKKERCANCEFCFFTGQG